MTHPELRKYRIIASAVTLLVAALIILLMLLLRLRFDPSAQKPSWPPVNDSELLMADEYVEVMPQPAVPGGSNNPDDGSAPPPPDAQDLSNQGTPAPEVTPLATQTQPSPAKQTPRQVDKTTGPSRQEIEAQQTKERREKEATAAAQNAAKIFGNTPASTGTGTGETGSGAGAASSSGRYRGGHGSGNADGRTVTTPKFNVPGSSSGTMKVIVYFDPAGKPLSTPAPRIVSRTGVCLDSEVSNLCLAQALRSTLTPKPDAPQQQPVTIIFNVQ